MSVPTTSTDPGNDTAAERLQRWHDRDGEIGLAAECEQLRHQLAERATEVADLRERVHHLHQRVGQLEAERPRALRVPTHGHRRSFARRLYVKGRSILATLLGR